MSTTSIKEEELCHSRPNQIFSVTDMGECEVLLQPKDAKSSSTESKIGKENRGSYNNITTAEEDSRDRKSVSPSPKNEEKEANLLEGPCEGCEGGHKLIRKSKTTEVSKEGPKFRFRHTAIKRSCTVNFQDKNLEANPLRQGPSKSIEKPNQEKSKIQLDEELFNGLRLTMENNIKIMRKEHRYNIKHAIPKVDTGLQAIRLKEAKKEEDWLLLNLPQKLRTRCQSKRSSRESSVTKSQKGLNHQNPLIVKSFKSSKEKNQKLDSLLVVPQAPIFSSSSKPKLGIFRSRQPSPLKNDRDGSRETSLQPKHENPTDGLQKKNSVKSKEKVLKTSFVGLKAIFGDSDPKTLNNGRQNYSKATLKGQEKRHPAPKLWHPEEDNSRYLVHKNFEYELSKQKNMSSVRSLQASETSIEKNSSLLRIVEEVDKSLHPSQTVPQKRDRINFHSKSLSNKDSEQIINSSKEISSIVSPFQPFQDFKKIETSFNPFRSSKKEVFLQESSKNTKTLQPALSTFFNSISQIQPSQLKAKSSKLRQSLDLEKEKALLALNSPVVKSSMEIEKKADSGGFLGVQKTSIRQILEKVSGFSLEKLDSVNVGSACHPAKNYVKKPVLFEQRQERAYNPFGKKLSFPEKARNNS